MIAYANYENYSGLLDGGFVIVDFFSKTCGPCKVLAKILERVVGLIDRDEITEKIGRYYYG